MEVFSLFLVKVGFMSWIVSLKVVYSGVDVFHNRQRMSFVSSAEGLGVCDGLALDPGNLFKSSG